MSARVISDTFPTPCAPSARVVRTCAAFGVVPVHTTHTHAPEPTLNPELLAAVRGSSITHITGPSGCGKTTLLRALALQLNPAPEPNDPDPSRPVLELIAADTRRAIGVLTASGLGEPKLWARPAWTLSTGQRARLDVARRIALAKQGQSVILDELGSCLDRVTAAALAAALPRIARARSIRILTAASAEDVPGMLDACVTIDASTCRVIENHYQSIQIRVEPGDLDDYKRLKAHHYRAKDPAVIERVLRAVRDSDNATIGVLCVSRPTLNASWRTAAFGDRFSSGDKRRDARRINDELRTISRIIVEPRARALGVATSLARAYLSDPITPCTESIASSGSLTGFFVRAGMRPIEVPRPSADLRLLDALEHVNLRPHELITHTPQGLLECELTTWARARKLDPNDPDLTTHAAVRLMTSPRAFAHTTGGNDLEHPDDPR